MHRGSGEAGGKETDQSYMRGFSSVLGRCPSHGPRVIQGQRGVPGSGSHLALIAVQSCRVNDRGGRVSE